MALPAIDGKKAIAAFRRVGFEVARVKGSHHIMKKEGHRFVLSVPVHGKDTVSPGTLRSLISAADLSVEEFEELLK